MGFLNIYINNKILRVMKHYNIEKFVYKKKSEYVNLFYNRSSTIPYCLTKQHIKFYNKRIVGVNLGRFHTSYKFGEFVFTRKPFKFLTKEKKKKKNLKR